MNNRLCKGIQGIRFWAMTLVVASHCWFFRQGAVGVDIFFALSGFMVSCPFSQEDFEYEYFKPKSFLNYYYRRFVRIIPITWMWMLYATFIIDYYDFKDVTGDHSLLLNMFFIKSEGHMWFLQQEVVFILFVPFILLFLAILKRVMSAFGISTKNSFLCVFLVLTGAVYLSYVLLSESSFRLYGNYEEKPFSLWLFLIGMSFGYLYKAIMATEHKLSDASVRVLKAFSIVYVVAFLLLSILTTEEILSKIDEKFAGYYIGKEHPIIVTYMAAAVIIIVSLLKDEDNILNRLLGNNTVVAIGNMSFVMYLIHYAFLYYFNELSTGRRFMVVYLVTLSIAYLIHNYIEKPLVGRLKKPQND